jgi:hypothetical protein
MSDNPNPTEEQMQLERLEAAERLNPTLGHLGEYSFIPPAIEDPKIIIPRRTSASNARYQLVAGCFVRSGLSVIDTRDQVLLFRCLELNRPMVEELLSLANRPETP